MAERDISDFLNPVLIKEIRQYFHNYLILGLTWILLVALLTLMVFVITAIDKGSKVNGEEFLIYILFIMYPACFCICGIAGQIRFAVERGTPELDYSRISPLSSARIIWGKMLGSMLMAGYLIFLSLPFVLISYFMNQVSIGEILQNYLAALFIFSFYFTTLALFCGSFGYRWMIWFYVPLVALLLFAIIYCGMGLFEDKFSRSWEVWFFCLIFFFTGLIFVWTLGLTGSAGYNRMRWARVYLLSLLVLFPLVVICIFSSQHSFILLGLLFCPYGGMFGTMIMALQSAWEKDRPPYYILKNAPRGWLKRLGVFLFTDGWSGGLLLCWGMLLLMLGAQRLAPLFSGHLSKEEMDGVIWSGYGFVSLALYTVFFAELGILFRLWTKIPGWMSLATVFTLFSVISLGIGKITAWDWYYDCMRYLIGVPFSVTSYGSDRIKEIYGVGWVAALLGLLLVGWPLLRNFRAFRQPGKEMKDECEA